MQHYKIALGHHMFDVAMGFWKLLSQRIERFPKALRAVESGRAMLFVVRAEILDRFVQSLPLIEGGLVVGENQRFLGIGVGVRGCSPHSAKASAPIAALVGAFA